MHILPKKHYICTRNEDDSRIRQSDSIATTHSQREIATPHSACRERHTHTFRCENQTITEPVGILLNCWRVTFLGCCRMAFARSLHGAERVQATGREGWSMAQAGSEDGAGNRSRMPKQPFAYARTTVCVYANSEPTFFNSTLEAIKDSWGMGEEAQQNRPYCVNYSHYSNFF